MLIPVQTLSWLPVDVTAASLSDILLSQATKASTANRSRESPELQPLFPVYHLENPVRWPWNDVLDVLGSRLKQKSAEQGLELPLVPYSNWLDRVTHRGESNPESDQGAANGSVIKEMTTTSPDGLLLPGLDSIMHTNKNGLKKTNPAYSLAHFFATDFRRMACGSVVLDMHRALEASLSLRAFASISNDTAIRDQMLERYIDYWCRNDFL